MYITDYFLEPIHFYNNVDYLSGKYENNLPKNTEIIKNLDLAAKLEFRQGVANNYCGIICKNRCKKRRCQK